MQALARRIIQVLTPVSLTHAEKPFDPFGRFPKLERVEVREPPKKDRIKRLRALREMLKSGQLSPEHILNRMRFYPNLSMFEAVERAEREGVLIVPASIHDKVLGNANTRYSTWSGTLIVYEAPDKSLGASVSCSWLKNSTAYSISFKIPKEFRGEKNCALVIEYPDFTFIKTGETSYEVRLTGGAEVHLVEKFPIINGWCTLGDLGIPLLPPVDSSNKNARFLWRKKSAYVSFVAGDFYDYFNRRGVYTDVDWFGSSAVAFIE